MTIILTENTKVLVQGITGAQGRFHTELMLKYGTNIVAGVTPGKKGTLVHGIHVYDSVLEAVELTDANTSIIFVPAPYAMDACIEAIDAGINTLVIITEHIPVHDTMRIIQYAKLRHINIIGPNTPGIVSPRLRTKVGILPNTIFKPGDVGVISRSGTLTYEIVNAMTELGLGQSTCLGLGGDPVTGMNFIDALKLFEADPETRTIVLIGEIGGTAEEEAANYIHNHISKKVVAYIAGQSAPSGKRMGHAGAIITRGMGSAESKIRALTGAGVKVAKHPREVSELIISMS
jgi:succinyl-CoA synthetase alpha subunit